MFRRLRNLGPGMLVTAAFIGPGTVTTATVAGARFGYVLLWALGFSVIATIVLQEMSARLGVGSGAGLGILLPVIAVFLLIAVNRRDLMGRYRNGLVPTWPAARLCWWRWCWVDGSP